MIIKLIAAKENANAAGRYAHDLARYLATGNRRWLAADAIGIDYGLTLAAYMTIAPPQAELPPDRVLFRAATIGGEVANWEEGLAEVERRLARRSRKVKKPVRHAVLSLQAGEKMSKRQCAQAVEMLAAELNCERAAILWAAHGDTDNFHLHFMIVTVDPDSGAALPFGEQPNGRAGYKEAMQRAIARIEHAQNLGQEPGARYQIMEGEVVRRPKPLIEKDRLGRGCAPLSQQILDWESRSGFASFTRVSQEVAGPIIDEAKTWQGLHRELAAVGIGIRAVVNGGELYAGDDHVKLSNVGRRHSFVKLENRLGNFEPAEAPPPTAYEPRILDAAKAERWIRRKKLEREIAGRIDLRVATLIASREAATTSADEQLSAYRDDVAGFDGDLRLRRDLAGAWTRLRASTRAAINAGFAARIDAVRALRRAVADTGDLDPVDLDALGAADGGMLMSWHSTGGPPPVMALDGYDSERRGDVVRYWAQSDQIRQGQPAMVDAGAIIWVNDRSDASIEAALMLARARYGSAAVFGNAAYLRQCQRVAKRLDIEIETITVTEAKRRAKRLRQDRDNARGRAVGTWLNRSERGSADRRAWALAYQRATPHDDDWARVDPPRTAADVPHHSAIPRRPTGSRFEPISEHQTGARPMPEVIPQRRPPFGNEGQGR